MVPVLKRVDHAVIPTSFLIDKGTTNKEYILPKIWQVGKVYPQKSISQNSAGLLDIYE